MKIAPKELDFYSSKSNLVDSRTGIIRYVLQLDQVPGEPSFFQYVSYLPDLNRIFPKRNYPEVCTGASINRHEAKVKAIGEAIERYCGSLYFDDEIIFDTFQNLGDKAVNPLSFPTCSKKEYNNPKNYLSKPREDLTLGWVSAKSIQRKRNVLVPASYVYLTYQPRTKDEIITLPISTGLAAGRSFDKAVLGGICEVIEREATMIMWLNQLPVPRIDLGCIEDKNILERIRRIEKASLQPYLFDTTTDVDIPCVFLVLVSKTNVFPKITVSAAAHPDPSKACIKALDEGVTTRRYCTGRHAYQSEKYNYDDFSNIRTFEDHLLLYADKEISPAFDFLFKSNTRICLSDMNRFYSSTDEYMLKEIFDRLSGLQLQVLIADLTREDVKHAGLSVVRVIIPGMQPLSEDHNIRFLGVRRLYEVPKKLGYRDKLTVEESLNPLPHPFA
jgi:ribosomal protein S12 methylthiotransferase accessory factor